MEELSRKNDTISVSELVFEGLTEQGVELDHVLPDYYPEIFKILSCRLSPKILAYNMLGDSKMMIDGCVDIKVLYLTDSDNSINCIEQKYTYSKTVDLGKCIIGDGNDITIKLDPRTDYCNCRAVSGRRIDVRGAVSTKIRINAVKSCAIPVMPQSIQVRTMPIDCCGTILSTEKQFSCKEEIETGASGISFIMRSNAIPKINEVRIIADKAIIKGVITLNAAYGIKQDDISGCSVLENMSADIPVSQIIDLDGVNDTFSCNAEMDILNCELTCSTDSGIIGCNILAVTRMCCKKESSINIPCDAFSTEYDTEHSVKQAKVMCSSSHINKTLSIKGECDAAGNEIAGVMDCSADIYNLSCRAENGELILSGAVCYRAICKNSEGVPCSIEKQEGFEVSVKPDIDHEINEIDFTAHCSDVDYSIRADGAIDISVKIDLCADLYENSIVDMIEYVTVNEDKPKAKQNDYALRIYYADGEEDCWSIAKRYSTSVDAIMTENDIEDRDIPLSGMILIPAI